MTTSVQNPFNPKIAIAILIVFETAFLVILATTPLNQLFRVFALVSFFLGSLSLTLLPTRPHYLPRETELNSAGHPKPLVRLALLSGSVGFSASPALVGGFSPRVLLPLIEFAFGLTFAILLRDIRGRVRPSRDEDNASAG